MDHGARDTTRATHTRRHTSRTSTHLHSQPRLTSAPVSSICQSNKSCKKPNKSCRKPPPRPAMNTRAKQFKLPKGGTWRADDVPETRNAGTATGPQRHERLSPTFSLPSPRELRSWGGLGVVKHGDRRRLCDTACNYQYQTC